MKKIVMILFGALIALQSPAYGQMEKLKEKLMEALQKKKEEKKENVDEKKEETKGYTKLLEGFTTSKGLFTVHEKDGKVYFEIPSNMFGRDMLLSSRVSEISNNKDMSAGQMVKNPLLIRFAKDKEKVYMYLVNTSSLCDTASPIYKSFRRNYLDPIWQDFDIKAMSLDSTAAVIDVSKFFCSDIKELNPFRESSILDAFMGGKPLSGSFQASSSAIVGVKAFPQNINVRSRMAYTVNNAPFLVVMTRSLILLPEKPMRPRLADARVGFFTTRKQAYSDRQGELEKVTYINRWRLEPKDVEKYKRGELTEPVKPIIFYVDDALPEVWKEAVKQGIEDWQIAFEAAGFKNAIIAKDYPKNDPDFDPEDIRYSCFKYITTPVANSMGPSWTDPRSGEIIQGDVLFYHNVIKILRDWRFVQTAAVDASARKEMFDDEMMKESLRYVAAHEVGHTLGLMHNMGASYAYPVDSLRSATFTQKYGTTPSIMDYARYNYVVQPGDEGVRMTPPLMGVYDCYAINWGYRPIYEAGTPKDEYAVLNKWIMEKAGDPMYFYGAQQIFKMTDPASQSESLGDDAVKASEYGIKNLKLLTQHLVDWSTEDGKDYERLSMLHKEVFNQFKRYIGHVQAYIGGTYLYNPVKGEEQTTYTFVDRDKQKEALKFIYEKMMDFPLWYRNQELMTKLPLSGNELCNYVGDQVKGLLTAGKLQTLMLFEQQNPENAYSRIDMMNDLRALVWNKKRDLNCYERAAQYAYVKTLLTDGGYITAPANSGMKLPFLAEEWMEYPPFEQIEQQLVGAGKEDGAQAEMNAIYQYELAKLKKMLKRRSGKGNKLDNMHYQNLYHQLDKVL